MTGSGATGALKKLQEIIGVYIPPTTKDSLTRAFGRQIPNHIKSSNDLNKTARWFSSDRTNITPTS